MLKLVNLVIWILALLIANYLFLRMIVDTAPYYQCDGKDEKGNTIYVKVVSSWFKKFLFLLSALLIYLVFFVAAYFMLEINLKTSVILSILSTFAIYFEGGILYGW